MSFGGKHERPQACTADQTDGSDEYTHIIVFAVVWSQSLALIRRLHASLQPRYIARRAFDIVVRNYTPKAVLHKALGLCRFKHPITSV